jgi:putative methyltransferase (TIGR04325 family)
LAVTLGFFTTGFTTTRDGRSVAFLPSSSPARSGQWTMIRPVDCFLRRLPNNTTRQNVLLLLRTLHYIDCSTDDLPGKLQQRLYYAVVNLTPMHPMLDFFTIQNMGFSFAPDRVMSVPNFILTMKGRGYAVIDQWQSGERA